MSNEFPENPDVLLQDGYTKTEEIPLYNYLRNLTYAKRVARWNSDLIFEVQIKYELFVSDTVGVSYEENLNYSFNGVDLVVWKKRESEDGDELSPQKIGESELNIDTLDEVETFLRLLGGTRTNSSTVESTQEQETRE